MSEAIHLTATRAMWRLLARVVLFVYISNFTVKNININVKYLAALQAGVRKKKGKPRLPAKLPAKAGALCP